MGALFFHSDRTTRSDFFFIFFYRHLLPAHLVTRKPHKTREHTVLRLSISTFRYGRGPGYTVGGSNSLSDAVHQCLHSLRIPFFFFSFDKSPDKPCQKPPYHLHPGSCANQLWLLIPQFYKERSVQR